MTELDRATREGEPATVEDVVSFVKERLSEISQQYLGREVTEDMMERFADDVANTISQASLEMGDEDLMDYVRVAVIQRPDPTVLTVAFEPKTERLRKACVVLHSLGDDDRAPIFCAYVDPLRSISGWGPTPIHAMADLERKHGDKN